MSSLRSDHYQDLESRPRAQQLNRQIGVDMAKGADGREGPMGRLLVFDTGYFRLGDAEDVGDVSL